METVRGAAADQLRRSRLRPTAVPRPAADRELAARAAQVASALAGPARPDGWELAGFARDVDLVRRQLGPIRDRQMLVASYEREGSRLAALRRLAADPAAPLPPLDPIEVAYAIRWLELADGGAPLWVWSALVASGRAATG